MELVLDAALGAALDLYMFVPQKSIFQTHCSSNFQIKSAIETSISLSYNQLLSLLRSVVTSLGPQKSTKRKLTNIFLSILPLKICPRPPIVTISSH